MQLNGLPREMVLVPVVDLVVVVGVSSRHAP
jgi:hypothetical protein